MKSTLAISLLLLVAGVIQSASAASLRDLEERIQVLEDEKEISEEERIELVDKIDREMDISGYADVEYHHSTKDADNPGFRLHHLSLFFSKEVASGWKFFSEIEYEDAPKFEGSGKDQVAPAEGEIIEDAKGKIFVEAVNLDYLFDPKLTFRGGRFFTPAGIWSIDHYPPFVPTQLRPQHIRKIFPQLIDGMMIYGIVPIGDSFFSYDLFVGNGEGNIGKKDMNSSKAAGLRTKVSFPVLQKLEVGATIYKDTLNDNTEKTARGLHARINFRDLSLQAEYAKAKLKPVASPEFESSGFYTQLMYDWRDWTFGYRWDTFEKDDTGLGSEIEATSAFLNFHVNKDIVLKLEHSTYDNEDVTKEDYSTLVFSLVAYLGS